MHYDDRDYIRYFRKNNYGAEVIYLSDPGMATLVSDLTGKKTVSARDLAVLEAITGKEAVETLPPSFTASGYQGTALGTPGVDMERSTTIFARAEALETR